MRHVTISPLRTTSSGCHESWGSERSVRAIVDVDALIGGLQPLIEPQMREKGLSYEVAKSPDAQVIADLEKARQILINLLSNAIKFTPEGGSICVVVEIRSEWVDIRVTDTGIGISEDKVAAVFEPFVQVRTYSSGQGGTGLGLAISRDLAEVMGGTLSVESTPGVGSTIALSLPTQAPPDESEHS